LINSTILYRSKWGINIINGVVPNYLRWIEKRSWYWEYIKLRELFTSHCDRLGQLLQFYLSIVKVLEILAKKAIYFLAIFTKIFTIYFSPNFTENFSLKIYNKKISRRRTNDYFTIKKIFLLLFIDRTSFFGLDRYWR